MSTYKLHLQYKGTNYLGWQIQPEGLTVQGELNKALQKISKDSELKSMGSGRTDRGVHALGQVVKVSMNLELGTEELKRGLNSLIPNDIQVQKVEKVDESFHPIGDADWKEYIYLFSTSKNLSLFHKDYVGSCTFSLDMELMKKACGLFIGSHDFSDFQCVGTEVNSTVRSITECELQSFDQDWGIFPKSDDVFMLRVKGEGFLKQMVRLMVGSLWNIGQSKVTLEQLETSLASPTGEKLGSVAPPEGLYLNQVFYP